MTPQKKDDDIINSSKFAWKSLLASIDFTSEGETSFASTIKPAKNGLILVNHIVMTKSCICTHPKAHRSRIFCIVDAASSTIGLIFDNSFSSGILDLSSICEPKQHYKIEHYQTYKRRKFARSRGRFYKHLFYTGNSIQHMAKIRELFIQVCLRVLENQQTQVNRTFKTQKLKSVRQIITYKWSTCLGVKPVLEDAHCSEGNLDKQFLFHNHQPPEG